MRMCFGERFASRVAVKHNFQHTKYRFQRSRLPKLLNCRRCKSVRRYAMIDIVRYRQQQPYGSRCVVPRNCNESPELAGYGPRRGFHVKNVYLASSLM